MKKNLPVPTAKDINEAHRLARASAETAVQHAIKCGQLLAIKKDELDRGDFDGWVEKHCDFGRSSAYAYMKVAIKSSRALDDFRSIQQALGYEKSKPKVKDLPKEAVSVLKAQRDGAEATEETGNDRPAASVLGDSPFEATSKPDPAPEKVAPEPDFDFNGYEPEDDDAYKATIENVMMADDKLAAMREELKQVHRELQGLKASRNHYQSEAGAAVRLAKSKEREIEKLKKELAKTRAENESLRERVAIMEAA